MSDERDRTEDSTETRPRGLRGFVAVDTLLSEVTNTASWLPEAPRAIGSGIVDLASGPRGFLSILAAFRQPDSAAAHLAPESTLDYFGFCLACHHATVATFIPTDVDTKIRGLLWRLVKNPDALDSFIDLTEAFCSWDVPTVSRRFVEVEGHGLFAGHQGEQLSVLVAGLGRAIHLGRDDLAERMRERIRGELAREAAALARLIKEKRELEALKMAAVMTHNAGDIDQGISFWPQSPAHTAEMTDIKRLAHENVRPWNGVFALAARIYKGSLSPEGHRNYPLRPVRSLRRAHDFLLGFAPFLDDWGALIGRDPRFTDEERAEILEALVVGGARIPGQRGYPRAIAGMLDAMGGRLDPIVAKMPARARAEFKSADLRKALAVPRISFESSMRSTLRRALQS